MKTLPCGLVSQFFESTVGSSGEEVKRARQVPVEGSSGARADDGLEAARRRGKRYTAAAFVSFAAIFVVLSSYELVAAAYGLGITPLPAGTPKAVGASACASELRGLTSAVERALAAALVAPNEAQADADFQAALLPEWDRRDAIERTCKDSPQGRDALAAVERLRRAGEGLVHRQAVELGPPRRDVAAYLPP